MSSDLDTKSLSERESNCSTPAIPTSLPNDSTSSLDYVVNSMPLPKPPENPANTVPSKTLWMGDIESWWEEQFITELWAKLNKKVEVKVIKPKQGLLMHQLAKSNGRNTGKHSGYCFIEFETPNEAQEALSLNGNIIPDFTNKTFRLNWASAATLNSEIAQTPEFSLFVGDLSPGTTEAHLLALFQNHFDSVKTVRVMTDPASGLSRCFGFVRFINEDDRKRALVEMNGKWLGGRQIRVALATPKHQQLTGFNKHLPLPPLSMDSMDMYQGGPPPSMHPMGYYPFGNQAPNNDQIYNDPNNTTVFVGGLANGVSDDTLSTLFEPFGEIINIKVPTGKGCGFVKFANRKNAETAIQNMQGFIIGGSRIRLSWGRSNSRLNMRRQQLQQQPQQMMSGAMYDYPPPQQMMAPPPHHGNNGNVEGYPPQVNNHGHAHAHGQLVGMPPGIPHPYIYDPYFASQQGNGSNIPRSNQHESGAPGSDINPTSPSGLVMEGLEGVPISPPQFAAAIDQNGSYMYLPAQPFPNVMGGLVGGYDANVENENIHHGNNNDN